MVIAHWGSNELRSLRVILPLHLSGAQRQQHILILSEEFMQDQAKPSLLAQY